MFGNTFKFADLVATFCELAKVMRSLREQRKGGAFFHAFGMGEQLVSVVLFAVVFYKLERFKNVFGVIKREAVFRAISTREQACKRCAFLVTSCQLASA